MSRTLRRALLGIAAACAAAASPNADHIRGLLDRGDWLLAGSILETSLPGATPEERRALLPLLARSLELAGRHGEAAYQILVLVEEYPEDAEVPRFLLHAGRLLGRSGAGEAARETFYRCLQTALQRATAGGAIAELDALTVDAAWEIARSEAASGDPARAVELVRRFRTMVPAGDPRLAEGGAIEMRAFVRLGRTGDALAAGARALEDGAAGTDLADIRIESARLLAMLGRVDEARAALRALGAETVDDAVALRVARAAVEVHRDDPVALLELREAVRARGGGEAWLALRERLDEILSRQPTIKMPAANSPGIDRWRAWSEDFQSTFDQLRQPAGSP